MTKAALDPAGFHRRIPLVAHQLVERATRTDDVIVLCHLGVPRVRPDDWVLEIEGLVRQPQRLQLSDLMRRKKATVRSIHQCAGSPLEPDTPTRRICNVEWGGVRLVELLDECGVLESARYVWSTGMDHGTFGGVACDSYVKDLPLERASADVLIAYELNGEPLRPENGYPARLVVPGFYGTSSVKWLSRIDLADKRAEGPFTTRWYNDQVRDVTGRATGETRPVWSIAPESVVVAPPPDARIAAGMAIDVWGWAWADAGVEAVDLSFDGGDTWLAAALEPVQGRGWQRFHLSWLPDRPGARVVSSRARGRDGASQPVVGARNAIHTVRFAVE